MLNTQINDSWMKQKRVKCNSNTGHQISQTNLKTTQKYTCAKKRKKISSCFTALSQLRTETAPLSFCVHAAVEAGEAWASAWNRRCSEQRAESPMSFCGCLGASMLTFFSRNKKTPKKNPPPKNKESTFILVKSDLLSGGRFCTKTVYL